MMRLVVRSNGEVVAEVAGDGGAVYIGAAPDCQVHLDDPRVAPQHAVIYADDQSWMIQPLVDRGDLLVGGEALHAERALRHGDCVRLFDYEIEARLDEAGDAESAPCADDVERIETEGAADEGDVLAGQHPDEHMVASMAKFARYQLPSGTLIKKLDDAICVQREHLVRAGKVNVELAGCETPEQIMDVTMRAVFESFSAHRVWIGLRRVNYGPMEYVYGRAATGQTIELPETGENLKPRVLDRNQFVLIPRVSADETISVLTGPLTGPDGTLGMIYVDLADRRRRFSEQEQDFFLLLLATIGAQLDATFKQIAKQRGETIRGEVAVAHAIQQRLNPRKLPQWEQLQFGAFREPGRERSSDIYDVVRLANGMAAFMLGHTTATGSLPCQHMAQAQAAFRTALMHMDAPHIFLKTLNVLLYDGTRDHEFHCLMGVIEPTNGRMRFAVAGKVRAYVIDERGEERKLTPDEPTPALGVTKAGDYANLPGELHSGETLVVFTPGVVSARNSKGEVFGEERFVNILCDGFGQLASAMLKEMLSDLQGFTEGGSQPTDITVILTHRV